MAKYTIQLKDIMYNPTGAKMLQKALSTYPLYSSSSDNDMIKYLIPKREELNNKLLNHYRKYEIGSYSVDEFIDDLEITMNEIMPYYNQLYKSVETMALIDDPFGNVDVTETVKETRITEGENQDTSNTTSSANDSSTSSTTSVSASKNLENETPQGNIGVSAYEIDSVSHADKITWNKTIGDVDGTTESETSSEAEIKSTGTTKSTDTFEHTFHKIGNQGVNTYAHDMEELRKTFIDVTDKIINDKRIKELFMLVY